jgi:gamma-glutamyltranspeptidase/glutathione hydrolase
MAAAMNVVEPCSTGLGGDAFALYYEAATQQVHCLMGNGESGRAASNDLFFSLWPTVGTLSPPTRSSYRSLCLAGAAPEGLSLEHLASQGVGIGEKQQPLDLRSGLAVTVPGAAMLWSDLVRTTLLVLSYQRLSIAICVMQVESFGNRSFSDNLKPAMQLAEDGFVLGPVTSAQWRAGTLRGEEALRVFRSGERRYGVKGG